MPVKAAAPSSALRSPFATHCLLAAAIVAVTLIAYAPASQAKFIWDDDWLLTSNENLGSLAGLGRIWQCNWWSRKDIPDYYPVTWTSFWLERRLWDAVGAAASAAPAKWLLGGWSISGKDPGGYHLTNILLHAANAVLLWRVLALLGLRWAWLAAVIFAVHPINAASVAWIAERKNTLSMLFYLLSIMFFLKFDQGRRRLHYWLSLGMFALALLSKTSVVMLPAVLLLIVWWRRDRVRWKDLLAAAPFFALAVASSVITMLYQSNVVVRGYPIRGPNEGFFFRLAVAGIAPWFYLLKIVWPHPLAMVYPRWQIDPKSLVDFLPGLLLIGLAVLFWRFRRGWGKPAFAALAYFLVTLFPVLGFFDMFYYVYSFVADHWVYVPIIGIIALAVGGAELASRRLPKFVLVSLVAVLIGAFVLLTYERSGVYKSSSTLWRDNIAKYPDQFLPHFNLGKALDDEGLFDEALTEYRRSAQLKPNFDRSYVNIGRIMSNRGEAAQAAGDAAAATAYYSEAASNFARAIHCYNRSVTAMMNLGAMLHLLNRSAEALNQLQMALDLQEDSAGVHTNMATIYASIGRLDEAIQHTRRVIELQPDDVRARLNLASYLAQTGEADEAIRQGLEALRLDPNSAEAHYLVAMQLRATGDRAGALPHFRAVLATDPNNIDTRNNLAVTMIEMGDAQGALEQFRQALSVQPNNPEVLANVAFALSRLGRTAEAIDVYHQALKSRPDWPATLTSLAWLLATRPDRSPSDIQEAIRLAQRACELTNYSDNGPLETLAIAYAEAGQYDQAIKAGEQVVKLAHAAGNDAHAAAIARQIQAWSANRPASQPASP